MLDNISVHRYTGIYIYIYIYIYYIYIYKFFIWKGVNNFGCALSPSNQQIFFLGSTHYFLCAAVKVIILEENIKIIRTVNKWKRQQFFIKNHNKIDGKFLRQRCLDPDPKLWLLSTPHILKSGHAPVSFGLIFSNYHCLDESLMPGQRWKDKHFS